MHEKKNLDIWKQIISGLRKPTLKIQSQYVENSACHLRLAKKESEHSANNLFCFEFASLIAQTVKNLPAVQETQVQSLDREDPLEKEMETHSNILAWKIPWTEEPGRLQSMRLQRVRHNWAISLTFPKRLLIGISISCGIKLFSKESFSLSLDECQCVCQRKD